MRRRLLIGIVVGSCAPRAPETLRNPAPIPREEDPPVGELPRPAWLDLVPRPHLDLAYLIPDFHEELRWPLSAMNHPSLEPRFAIAQALAEPGVGWTEPCGTAQNRHGRDKELLSYLRGWCSAIEGDVDAACANLSPLVGTTRRGIDTAVKLDLANIFVDQGPADKAEHWLNKHRILDTEILDLMAASYFEIGKPQDAFVINRRVMDSDDRPTDAQKCMRLTREIVLSGKGTGIEHEMIEAIVASTKTPDPTCLSLHHKLRCWARPGRACDQHFRLEGIDPAYTTLIDAYNAWPKPGDSAWWVVINEATAVLSLPGADRLAAAALHNLVRSYGAGCHERLAEG